MPYTSIHWIKLKLEILNDKRFLFDLDDEQKLLFLGLLILAGVTRNQVPDDVEFIKNRLNLSENSQKIRENLSKIYKTFPKTMVKNGFVKFKNFNDLHNPIRDVQRSAEGVPKERLDKSRVDKIREEYIRLKGWSLSNFTSDDYARTAKAIKTLINKSNNKDEQVLRALDWASRQTWCDWTLETIYRKWQDFLKWDALPALMKEKK